MESYFFFLQAHFRHYEEVQEKLFSKLNNLEKQTSINMPKFLYHYQCLTIYLMYQVGMSISGAVCQEQERVLIGFH